MNASTENATPRQRELRIRPIRTRAARVRRWTAMLVVLVLVGFVAPQAIASGEPSEAIPFDTYTVASGETLWSIASAVTAPGDDVNETVRAIQDLNQMGSSALMAGEQIFVPALD